MKKLQRGALTMVALAAGLAAQASLLGAQQQQPLQRGQTPGPRFMVPILRGQEKTLGIQVADAIRERLAGEFLMRTLYIVPWSDIKNTLEASGYSSTEPLNPNDTKQLATLIRADEYIEGTIARENGELSADLDMYITRGSEGQVQPLAKVSGARAGDLARAVTKQVEEARKQLPHVSNCFLSWRQNKHAEALAAARKAIEVYPKSSMARVCVLEIYNSRKLGADSIISAAEAVLSIHNDNRRALAMVADAYGEKKNEDKHIETLMKLLAANPTDVRLQERVVRRLGESGKAALAKPIIDEAVKQNPGDPSLIRLQWQVYLALKDWKGAVAIGEEMIKTDTAAADSSFFNALIAAYVNDSQPPKAAEAAARAAAKFTTSASFPAAQAQLLRQAGQLPAALEAINKAIALDGKNSGYYLQQAAIYTEMQQPDNSVASLRKALENSADKATVGGMALSAGNQIFRKFNTSKDTTDLMRALPIVLWADSVRTSPTSALLIGAISLSMGNALIQGANDAKSCEMATRAGDFITEAQIALPKAAADEGNRATVAQLMTSVQTLSSFPDRQKAAFCKKPNLRN
ncbi:MAG: tetratricopeptide repeat protein [Gemmatimonadaceae bacterium]